MACQGVWPGRPTSVRWRTGKAVRSPGERTEKRHRGRGGAVLQDRDLPVVLVVQPGLVAASEGLTAAAGGASTGRRVGWRSEEPVHGAQGQEPDRKTRSSA